MPKRARFWMGGRCDTADCGLFLRFANRQPRLDRPELWLFYLAFTAAIPFSSFRSRSPHALIAFSAICPTRSTSSILPLIGALAHFGGTHLSILPATNFSREIDLIIVVLAATALDFVIEMPIEKIRQRLSAPGEPDLRAPAVVDYEASRAAAPAE